MADRDHDFDDWVDFVEARNPVGLSDVWLRAARTGWDARKQFEATPKGTWVGGSAPAGKGE
jgi:hypothetical protein